MEKTRYFSKMLTFLKNDESSVKSLFSNVLSHKNVSSRDFLIQNIRKHHFNDLCFQTQITAICDRD